jgi:hypothetical protein
MQNMPRERERERERERRYLLIACTAFNVGTSYLIFAQTTRNIKSLLVGFWIKAFRYFFIRL